MKHKLFKKGAAGVMTGLMCMVSVPAFPTAVLNTAYAASAGQTLSVGNGQTQHKEDNVDGYSYEIWLDQTGGSGSMTLGSGGSFNTEWSAQVSAGNFLARRGRNYDASKKATQYGTIVMDYAADYSASAQGNSRLCVYGWMKDPLVEYYIIEDWVNWCPSANGGAQTVTIDGAEYEIFQLDHTGPTILGTTQTFKQYFSVRKQKRTSGTITVSDHFAAWEKAGWNIGNLTEVALNVEGWESSGKANVSKLTISAGEGGGNNNAQPAQQNNDWNQPQQQNNDWNQQWNQPQQNDWNNQQQNNDWNQQWNQPQQNDWNNQQQNQDWNQWNQQPQQQNNNQQASSGSGFNASATMADDFRNGSSKYFIASDGWTNGDPFDCGWYASQTSFSGGALNLTIDRDNSGKYNYAGAEYRTNDFYHYGYYETSMQAIKNKGVVSSFFTYTGESDGNPWDEIDIEILGKDTTKVQFNYYTNGKADHEYMYDLGFDSSQGFHTYGFDWQPDHITWYVDGKPVYTATDNIPKTAGKLMMNVWPGKGVDEWLDHYDGRTPLTARYEWATYDKNGKSGGQQQNNNQQQNQDWNQWNQQPQQTTTQYQPATTVTTTVVTTQQDWNQWNNQNNDWNNQNQQQNQDWNQQWTQPQVNDWNQQNNDWNNQNQQQNQDWNQQWTQPQVNDWNQQNNDWNNQNQQQNQDWNNQNQWNNQQQNNDWNNQNQQQNNDWGNWNQWNDQQWNQWNEWNPWSQQVSMWGDANVNGSVDIGDAVSIMQGLANPDQYGFNDQNRWNADVYQAGTGVTAQDATAIQRYLLQSTPQLPESYWVGGNNGWYN